jgi:hypothetical protein
MLEDGMVRPEIGLLPRTQPQALGFDDRRLQRRLLLAERDATEALVEARDLAAGV